MTSLPTSIADALEAHESFSPLESDADEADAYTLETTVFETTVIADEAEEPRDGAFTVGVRLPTLGAATDDHVAPVVEDGWFETFERRLEDTFSVAHTSTHEEPRVERDRDEEIVEVTLEYVAWDANEGVDDAKTLIEYVEGTYAQGIVPGYSYRGPAATLLENAQQAGAEATEDNGVDGADRTGTR